MRRLGDRFETLAAERGWRLGRVRRDLAMMNRTVGSFLAAKVVYGSACCCWRRSSGRFCGSGPSLPPAVPALAAIVFGLFGFFLPDLALRGEAERRRGDTAGSSASSSTWWR